MVAVPSASRFVKKKKQEKCNRKERKEEKRRKKRLLHPASSRRFCSSSHEGGTRSYAHFVDAFCVTVCVRKLDDREVHIEGEGGGLGCLAMRRIVRGFS